VQRQINQWRKDRLSTNGVGTIGYQTLKKKKEEEEMAQTMYTRVSKCKNDKIKERKKIKVSPTPKKKNKTKRSSSYS
jgi:uncharacterized protein YgiB involved in biofilm formation